MAGEWRDQLWGELAVLKYGKRLSGYSDASGRYRVYGTNGPIGWHDEPLCKHETVVIGRKGAYRGVYYSPEPCFVIDTAFYLEPRVDFDMRWAYYELLTHDINSMDSGSAIPSTSREAFYQLPVRVPPKEEQRAIAHILGTLDDKIELLRRMNETLEAMARALFKSWFVDFDPVIDNALEAGNPIPDELKEKAKRRLALGERRKPLPEHLRRLFPDRFVDSELGPIPEGWRVTTIGGIAKVASGKRPGQRFLEPREDAKVPLYGGNGPIAYVREPLYEQPILLTGRVGTLGSVFRITSPCWPLDNTLVLLARKPECYEFLYFQLNLLDLQVLNRGSTQPLLTQSDLKAQPIIKPPDGLLVRFHVIAAVLLEKVDTNQKLDRALTAIRDALLPKLISGEIRVSDAEQFLAEVNI